MNSVERILYLWLSNDEVVYHWIVEVIQDGEGLQEYVSANVVDESNPFAEGIIRDILNLVNWQTLYEHIKD